LGERRPADKGLEASITVRGIHYFQVKELNLNVYKNIGGKDMSIMNLIEEGKKSFSKRQERRTAKDTGIGAAIGLAVGAVVGVLLSPKSGQETRENIAVSAKELSGKAKDVLERAKEKVEKAKEELKEIKDNPLKIQQ